MQAELFDRDLDTSHLTTEIKLLQSKLATTNDQTSAVSAELTTALQQEKQKSSKLE